MSKVFISWSGKNSKSHRLALLLKDWIPKVIQDQPTFVSSHDIEAGNIWVKQLMSELESSSLGIICLSRECLQKPWILFEAGAIAMKIGESRVMPILIDVTPADVSTPLSLFQLKSCSKDDIYDVIEVINRSRDDQKLQPSTLADSLGIRWSDFAGGLKEIEGLGTPDSDEHDFDQNKALREILDGVRGLSRSHASLRVTSERPDPAVAPPSIVRNHLITDSFAGKCWDEALEAILPAKPMIYAFASKVAAIEFNEMSDTIYGLLPADEAMALDSLNRDRMRTRIEVELSRVAGRELKFEARPAL